MSYPFRFIISGAACLLIAVAGILTVKHITKKKPPRLGVVIVVDQFAYHYLPKLSAHFKYGLKKLMSESVVYHNAYHAHGVPETTPGHHAISTGTLPKYHGATFNAWVNEQYLKNPYELDHGEDAAVLQGDECYLPGKSAKNTMVDGLSDQFIQAADQSYNHVVYALSHKAHPVISCANRLGKALWFDPKHGSFTSSKKYFEDLPDWVKAFNKKHDFEHMEEVTWKPMYAENSAAYHYPDTHNYDYSTLNFGLVGKTTRLDCLTGTGPADHGGNKYDLFLKTPAAGDALFKLAETCILSELQNSNDRMLLWVSTSNLDLCGHFYGPDSMECTDIIYHLDRQLDSFFKFLNKHFKEDEYFIALTADHGICPFPELTHSRGVSLARRIMAPDLIKAMNQMIAKKYSLKNMVKNFEPNFFVLNKELLASQSPQKREAIISSLKEFLIKEPGIKKAWASDELQQLPFDEHQFEQFHKNQLYKGRGGDIVIMTEPYCLVTKYAKGTSHSSPYEYDTHVPLMLYQKGRIEKKVVTEKVWIPQLTSTIARLLGIARPSASPFKELPGIV